MSDMKKLLESIDRINEGRDVRYWTNLIDQAMDEGIMDPRAVADAALSYLSEDQVHDMARANDWLELDDPDYYDDDDDDDYDEDEYDDVGADGADLDYDDRRAALDRIYPG